MLTLGDHLKLSPDFATKTAAILAQRRKGKTYTASVLAEEMVAAKQPFVALDPTGAWWGLRAGADGKSAGLPVVVLGGQHGDVPLERTVGRLIADLVVEEPGYYIIDFSLFESGEAERQFAVDFAERLYRAKGQPGRDFPLHLFVDEADRFIPQQMRKGSGDTSPRLLGAFEAIVRRGGLRGLGTTLISQRAAVVNKNVLEMLDILIALRTVGPNDRKAIDDYIKAHGTDAERTALLDSLASLDIGEAWVWEPGADPPLFRRVRIRARHTFNSSATPTLGQKRVEPKRLADVDLAALQTRMAATIEKAKGEDPRELRKRILDLERQLRHLKVTDPSLSIDKPSKPALTAADRALLEKFSARFEQLHGELTRNYIIDVEAIATGVAKQLRQVGADIVAMQSDGRDTFLRLVETKQLGKLLQKIPAPSTAASTRHTPVRANGKADSGSGVRPDARTARPAPRAVSGVSPDANGALPAAKQKILNGLAFLNGIGVALADKTQLALLVGVSPTSGGYFNNLGALRADGLIAYPSAGTVALTDAGHARASTDGVPTTTDELHDAIRAKLPAAKWRIVEALIRRYPHAMSKDELAEQLGVSPTSGGYFNNLGSLRSLGLIDYPSPGTAAAQPVLFLE